jgi:hypothetical protein
MGHWGFNYEESDTYLDIIGSVFDPIAEVINAEEFYIEAYIAASGVLLDLLFNKKLRYYSQMELVKHAIINLTHILDTSDFKDWSPNEDKRKESVKILIKDLKKLYKQGNRSTSLLDKMMEDNK